MQWTVTKHDSVGSESEQVSYPKIMLKSNGLYRNSSPNAVQPVTSKLTIQDGQSWHVSKGLVVTMHVDQIYVQQRLVACI